MNTKTAAFSITIEDHELTITNPEKPLWHDPVVTKFDYLQKLIQLAPYLLPYCQNRYLTTIRYPHGVGDTFFYQKNCPQPKPPFVNTATLNGVEYVDLDSIPTLIWLGNLACLEFHPSFHFIGDDRPAEWLIDIDPSRDPEPRLAEATSIVGEVLRSLNIEAIPKTSGATGIQIYVPIQQNRYTFEQLRSLGKFIAEYLVNKHSDLFTIARLKKERNGLIYFDYLQHWPGKTLSAPYTTRARKNATVSTPLLWEELNDSFSVNDYNLHTIEARLKKYGDLIQKIPPQSLDDVLAALEQKLL